MFLMTALILSRQQCLISLCHKAGDLILCGVYIGLYENVGLYNTILYSDCQIHFSASTKHLINDKLPKQLHNTILLLHMS